jgi:plasmid stability protein
MGLSRVIPQWYLLGMAMTLRLNDQETEALRARAADEGRSMQDVAKQAIAEYLSQRSARLTSAISRVATDDAELLDRLSR